MFCTKCGAENPADAEFCYKCGRPLIAPQPEPAIHSAANSDTMPPAHLSSPLRLASGYKSATAYGWLFVLAGFYLWVTGVMTLGGGQQLTPAASPFGNARAMGAGATLSQALLFGMTGFALIRRSKIRTALVWASTALSGLGVLLRGFIPLDILLWLAGLSLAIWYTKRLPLPVTEHQPLAAQSPVAHGRSWLDGTGIALSIVIVLAILVPLLSLAKWSDRGSASQAPSENPIDQALERSRKQPLTPEESKLLQGTDLLTLSLDKLIARCGKPQTDTTRTFKEAKIKGFLRRDISYKSERGSAVMLTFYNLADDPKDKDWHFFFMLDGGEEYRAETDDDVNHILAALPCMHE
jgi:zinc-ribbon domain